MITLSLPERCLTLLPPWPQAILYAGKRLENRSAGVAGQLSAYGGLIGLSQSKGSHAANTIDLECYDALRHLCDTGMAPWKGKTARELGIEAGRGKLFIVAELVRIALPHEAPNNPWHIEGQHGLILGRIWEVEPVACTGGVGAWRPSWCVKCNHIYADATRVPGCCYSCKAIFPESRLTAKGLAHLNANWGAGIQRPQLRVIREVTK